MIKLNGKVSALKRSIERLQKKFGIQAFDIVDHWDGDMCAVGIARPDNHGALVYISTYNQADDRFFVSLESPSLNAEKPYKSVGDFDKVDFKTLENIVRRHLSLY